MMEGPPKRCDSEVWKWAPLPLPFMGIWAPCPYKIFFLNEGLHCAFLAVLLAKMVSCAVVARHD